MTEHTSLKTLELVVRAADDRMGQDIVAMENSIN